MDSLNESLDSVWQREKLVSDDTGELIEETAGVLRGVSAAIRASAPALKHGVRAVGQARALAFASEGGVAAQSYIPRVLYIGTWLLSGVAVGADIVTKTWDAPLDKKYQTAFYYISFHVPASLVIPAVIIHKIVHTVEHICASPALKSLPQPAKKALPVVAALLSIIPVVPIVDHTMEAIMEPTLGKYLDLEFHATHHNINPLDKVETLKKEL